MFTGIDSAQLLCKRKESAGAELRGVMFLTSLEDIKLFDTKAIIAGPISFGRENYDGRDAADILNLKVRSLLQSHRVRKVYEN